MPFPFVKTEMTPPDKQKMMIHMCVAVRASGGLNQTRLNSTTAPIITKVTRKANSRSTGLRLTTFRLSLHVSLLGRV